MKVIWWNITRLLSCFSYLISLVKRIFGKGRNRKDSGSNALPLTGSSDASHQLNESSTQESDWVEWGNDEQFTIKIEPSSPPPSNQQDNTDEAADADDLFKDMTPVFKKAKKIVIKSKQAEPEQHYNNSPSRLNFDMTFPPTQTDLGSWEDTSGGWDENEISEREIQWETENVIKQKKQAERERRALEQQRRKEEREALRLAKKNQQHLGVKVNS